MNVSKLVLFLQVIYILHDMPIIGYNFPSVIYAVIIVFLFVYLCNKVEPRKLLGVLSIFLIQVIGFSMELFQTSDIVTILQKLSSVFQSWIYPLMAINIIETSNIKDARIMFLVYVTSVVVTGVTTYSCLVDYPGAIREVVSESTSHPLFFYFINRNLGGFDFIYGLLTIEVALVYMAKHVSIFPKSFLLKCVIVLTIALLVILIIESEFTMAMTCSLGLLMVFLFPKKFRLKHILMVILFGGLFFVGSQRYVANTLIEVSMQVESEDVSARLSDIAYTIKGEQTSDESDFDLRKNAWQKPLQYFAQNPLGSWDNKNISSFGGHSFILDSIGIYGFFSFIFLFLMIRNVYLIFIVKADKDRKGYYWLFFLIFILTAIINPHLNTKDILFFAPIFFYMFDYYKKKYASFVV